MTDFNKTILRLARKDYKCRCCHKWIKAGEHYIKEFGVCEGNWYQNKYHAKCGELVERVANYMQEPIDPGEAIELAKEHGIEV